MEKKRILVIEDLEIARAIIRATFENEYEIYELENGLDAFNFLQEDSRFDLIILDLNMPVMNGESFLFVKSETDSIKDIPVIITSGDDNKDLIYKFIKSGVNAYVPKPFDVDKLSHIVHGIIENSEKYGHLDGWYLH